MTSIVYAKSYAQNILYKAQDVSHNLLKKYNVSPKVCLIVVGDDYVSHLYIKNKIRAASKSNVIAEKIHLSYDTAEEVLLDVISKFNNDNNIHGIIVQMPLPPHINYNKVINAIDVNKDVDGFNSINVGNLTLNKGFYMVPCTAFGCLNIITSIVENLSGINVCIVGRSNIVGMPLSNLLTHSNATVTLCHSHTKNLSDITSNVDVVVTAIGRPHYFNSKYFASNSIVIDVGINRIANNRIVGDVNFDDVVNKVSYITPVPGGIGLMTVAYLIANTIKLACFSCGDDSYKKLYI